MCPAKSTLKELHKLSIEVCSGDCPMVSVRKTRKRCDLSREKKDELFSLAYVQPINQTDKSLAL